MKGFGEKLLRSVAKQKLDGWQRRYCVVDFEQRSFVYGQILNEGAFNESWELKVGVGPRRRPLTPPPATGRHLLAVGRRRRDGVQVCRPGECVARRQRRLTAAQPACVSLRPRIGAKIKTYTVAAADATEARDWAHACVQAGATLVDTLASAPPLAHYSGLAHKLGGGLLREWQLRLITIECDGWGRPRCCSGAR